MMVTHVVGARPNFVKAAPVIRALDDMPDVIQRVIHTGQHYDPAMSDNIMRDVAMREPDINLAIGSGSHAEQTAKALVALEEDFRNHQPDIVVVYGDVNSTLAGALAASKLNIPLAHVEAGLRSFDRSMPEEINRILVDSISNIHFVTSEDAIDNLVREGISVEQIVHVGNTMIDSIAFAKEKWEKSDVLNRLGIDGRFALVTLHRPSNVDDSERLAKLVAELQKVSHSLPILFPVHPRTRVKFEEAGLVTSENLRLIDPVPYLDSIFLISQAEVVVTDSGGIQEEASYLGTPCLTVRTSTERPITITKGTNRLIDIGELGEYIGSLASGLKRALPDIPLWDGQSSFRLAISLIDQHRALRSGPGPDLDNKARASGSKHQPLTESV